MGNNTHTPICTCKNHTAELMRKVGGERTIERRYVRCVGLFLFCSLCWSLFISFCSSFFPFLTTDSVLIFIKSFYCHLRLVRPAFVLFYYFLRSAFSSVFCFSHLLSFGFWLYLLIYMYKYIFEDPHVYRRISSYRISQLVARRHKAWKIGPPEDLYRAEILTLLVRDIEIHTYVRGMLC